MVAVAGDHGREAMKGKLISEGAQRTFAVILDAGDEAVACLTAFAKEHRLSASQFTALGAFRACVLGYFDWQKKDYRRIPLDEQVEVLALLGVIALDDGAPKLHAHVVVGKVDGTAHGGHLLEASVRPTLEVIITESPVHLQRRSDAETGLALIRL
jgi:predicted DNA-binding protein with PD1-like motif